jgi:hypothetical protein
MHYKRFVKHGDPNVVHKRGRRPSSPKICSVEGCGKKHLSKGFCAMHYKRFVKHGDPNVVLRERNLQPPEFCTIEGCGKKHLSKGFCNMHYTRFVKHGDPNVVCRPGTRRNSTSPRSSIE